MKTETIQDFLKGIDAEFDKTNPKAIKMVRHADARTKQQKGKLNELTIKGKPFPTNIPNLKSLYLYRNDLFNAYQSEQLKNTFKGIKYIVVFLGDEGTTSRFIGVNKIVKSEPSPYRPEEVVLTFEPVAAFDDIKERLIIDWGKATTSWHQYYYKEKTVIAEVEPFNRDSVSLSADHYKYEIFSFPELERIITIPEWVEKLKSTNCIYAILDNKTGKLYVGASYGNEGILGRWEEYAKTGHGNNKELKELLKNDPNYARDHFQWTILETIPLGIEQKDAIELEQIWKKKLGTGVHGYTCN